MSLRPNSAVAKFDEDTPVTLLDGPPEGTSRLVSGVDLFNLDWVTRMLRLYMYDGSVEYELLNVSTQPVLTNSTFAVAKGRPFVLEYGDSLKVVSTAAHVFAEPTAIADYADDTNAEWHNETLEAPSNAIGVLVGEPPGKRRRIVKLVTYENEDDIAHTVLIGSREISSGFVYYRSGLADLPAGSLIKFSNFGTSVVLNPGFELVVWYLTATNSTASHLTSHYFECNEDDSGEG